MRVVLAAAMLAILPVVVDAQQTKVHRVGVIYTTVAIADIRSYSNVNARSFRDALRDLGYIEGKNLALEWRSLEGKSERAAELVNGLLDAKVDVIVTNTNSVTRRAMEITRTMPIVMAGSVNPVESGLVRSLPRPGGNVTGLVTDPGPEVVAKRVQILKEFVPNVSRVAYLWGVVDKVDRDSQLQILRSSASVAGVKMLNVEHEPTEYQQAFDTIVRERADALVVAHLTFNFANRRLLADFASKQRLPAIYPVREYAESGGLIAYGADAQDLLRRAARYVDRILKGAKPADLPVELPTKFELVINLKAAKAQGITIPPSLVARADHVIE